MRTKGSSSTFRRPRCLPRSTDSSVSRTSNGPSMKLLATCWRQESRSGLKTPTTLCRWASLPRCPAGPVSVAASPDAPGNIGRFA